MASTRGPLNVGADSCASAGTEASTPPVARQTISFFMFNSINLGSLGRRTSEMNVRATKFPEPNTTKHVREIYHTFSMD